MVNSKSNVKNNNNRCHVFMLKENELELGRFVVEKRRNDVSERAIETHIRLIIELDETIDKPFRDATKEDINRFVT